MFRLLAGILILYGSTGYALKVCQEMRTRLKHIGKMQEIFRLFQAEITYNRGTLPETCLQISKRIEEPYKSAMEQICQKTQEESGRQFPAIWKTEMERCLKDLPTQKEEQDIFLEFGYQSGFTDVEMQLARLKQNITQLGELYGKLKSAMESKEKVITGVGVLGGLMLVIILI